MNNNFTRITIKPFLVPFSLITFIWLIYSIEIRYNLNFNDLGIFPKRFSGLLGILTSPFIHSNISHLYSNTFPLFILSVLLFYFYRSISVKVLVFSILFTGLLTWIIGRPSYHIGASGVIYALFSFLFFKGILTKYYRLIALSLLVVFLYGSMIWYTLPIEAHISWEGHLSGFITGTILALIYKKNLYVKEKFEWEKPHFIKDEDPFLKQFDEEGYFFEIKPDENEELLNQTNSAEPSVTNQQINITYTYKPKDKL